ncbi:hydrogenase maturation nickel metallochaperone HypA [Granulicella sibirica]|uniref:Hydrogenase maturation factor HypA n=1 Tax=Granulicella sibirica TaxID=2479048 RepID=A0A4Q0SW30_9BACT|nr:hydrogenase maturation nickel metallochaperone HypA [Granulicella sibirica]RXH54110.1 [NiFe] hydrogenase nickel incorporation protein HypA [Granulicella sibirica]
MHEISIAISIVDQVVEESESLGGLLVTAVHLSLGLLAGVDEQALQFCFKAACEGTLLEGSTLIIQLIPVTIFCPTCGMERMADSVQQPVCTVCRSATRIIKGHELEVAALEVAA